MKSTRILCPGGCGGEATVEPRMTLKRNGKRREVYPVRCSSRQCCDEESRRGGRTWYKPALFLLDKLPETIEPGSGRSLLGRAESLRKRLKLSQKAMALEIGMPPSTLCCWLTGRTSRLRSGHHEAVTRWVEGRES